MCGSGANVYGIIAALVAATAMLVMAFADGRDHATAPAHTAVAHAVQIVSPVSVELQREGAHIDIYLRF